VVGELLGLLVRLVSVLARVGVTRVGVGVKLEVFLALKSLIEVIVVLGVRKRGLTWRAQVERRLGDRDSGSNGRNIFRKTLWRSKASLAKSCWDLEVRETNIC